MPDIEKRTVSLRPEQVAFINEKVGSGHFASASEVVRAGLRALQERDNAVEAWLHNEVTKRYDAIAADPKRGISAENAFDAVRAHHANALKGGE